MKNEPQSPRLALLSMTEVSRIAAEAGIPAQLADRNLFRILLHSPRVAKSLQIPVEEGTPSWPPDGRSRSQTA